MREDTHEKPTDQLSHPEAGWDWRVSSLSGLNYLREGKCHPYCLRVRGLGMNRRKARLFIEYTLYTAQSSQKTKTEAVKS